MMRKLLALTLLFLPLPVFAQTFALSTPTVAIGAGTPSRAITIQITGTTSSTTSFALSDGGLGGVFYPASPVTIAAGTSGSTQFVYTAPAGTTTGTAVTLQAVATGGISATHTLSTSIGVPTTFAADTYTGTSGAAVLGRTATTGGVWNRVFLNTFIDSVQTQDGSNHFYISSAPGGTSSGSFYYLPSLPATNEQDVTCTITGFDDTHNDVGCFVDWPTGSSAGNQGGYIIYRIHSSEWLVQWQTNDTTSGALGTATTPSPPTGGATQTLQISVRIINGTQYVFGYVGGSLISGFPVADSHLTTPGYPGTTTGHGTNSISTGYLEGNFVATNVDWAAPPISGTYYVAASGSDSNNGTSPSTPWQTLTRASLAPYGSGSSILLRCGDTFSGTLSVRMIGTQAAPDSISAYGTCPAPTFKLLTIPVGAGSNAPIISSGAADGIDMTSGSEYYSISGLTITGCGWTGTQPSITVCNGGSGVNIFNTSGTAEENVDVFNNTISGYQQGVTTNESASSSYGGIYNLGIYGNIVSGNLTGGILVEGYNAYSGGPQNQFQNVYIGYNYGVGIPGDPNSGSGGVHGSVKTEAWFINVQNTTGSVSEANYSSQVGGWGGYTSGLTLGGSASIQYAGSKNFAIIGNEITQQGEVSTAPEDGAAIDTDTNTTNYEVAYNLTYDNVGPGIQMGSSGGYTNSSGYVHHNISYLDNQTIANMNQGAIRFWGNATTVNVYNNTVVIPCTTPAGTRSVVSFEVSTSNTPTIMNNVFSSCASVPIYHGTGVTLGNGRIGTSLTYGNLYYAPSSLLLSDTSGSSTGLSITTLAQWQADGYETLNGNNYGVVGNPNLLNTAGFSPPSGGFLANGGLNQVTNFNLGSGSAAIGAGVDPQLVGVYLRWVDFRRSLARNGVPVDIGANADLQSSASTSGSPGAVVIY